VHEQASGNKSTSSTKAATSQNAGQTAPVSPMMSPAFMSPGQILQLQRAAGNRALQGMVAQRAGSGNGPQPPAAPTPEQTRKTELDAHRDVQAPLLAQAALGEAKQKVKGQLGLFLSKGDKTASIRTSLDNKATTAVTSNMENAAGASDQAKSDAKKYAKEYIQIGVNKSLDDYAQNLTTSAIPDTKLADIEAKAKEGFNTITPITKQSLDQQKTKAPLLQLPSSSPNKK
jgi:hypothetical protein